MAATKPFSRVMVAFDGSDDSVKAIRLAGALASKLQMKFVVVHVYSSPAIGFSGAAGIPIPDYKPLEDAKKDAAKEVLSRGLKLAAEEGIEAEGELIESPSVVEALVEFAAKDKTDLIIAGTRGMTRFRKLVLGSVSSGLVSHAPCSVLVAR